MCQCDHYFDIALFDKPTCQLSPVLPQPPVQKSFDNQFHILKNSFFATKKMIAMNAGTRILLPFPRSLLQSLVFFPLMCKLFHSDQEFLLVCINKFCESSFCSVFTEVKSVIDKSAIVSQCSVTSLELPKLMTCKPTRAFTRKDFSCSKEILILARNMQEKVFYTEMERKKIKN